MSFARSKQYELFTPVMHREYERAVKKMREELSQGRTYEHAYNTLTDISQEIKTFIKEDFLKIIIAEEHFGAGIEISDIALLLELPYEKATQLTPASQHAEQAHDKPDANQSRLQAKK